MAGESERLDLWLWQGRFFKSRTLAARMLRGKKLRMNGAVVAKPARPVAPGAVLTFPQGNRIRVVEVLRLATRRGPAREAATLYRDLTPPPGPPKTGRTLGPSRAKGAGRPTKKDRRAIQRLKAL
jgi:ribosome-associated heat shock protein Hsp15